MKRLNIGMDSPRNFRFIVLALGITLTALNLLGIAYTHERTMSALHQKWLKEDDDIILNQEVEIENLRTALSAEKKAHAETAKRLAKWESKSVRQTIGVQDARLLEK